MPRWVGETLVAPHEPPGRKSRNIVFGIFEHPLGEYCIPPPPLARLNLKYHIISHIFALINNSKPEKIWRGHQSIRVRIKWQSCPKMTAIMGLHYHPTLYLKKCITSPFHSWPDMLHESMLCMQKHSWIGLTVQSDPYESLGPTKNMDFFPSA